jgi:hypothetical protein
MSRSHITNREILKKCDTLEATALLPHYFGSHSTPPKSLAQGLLQGVEFVESDKTLIIP